jgi:hypothetical protein
LTALVRASPGLLRLTEVAVEVDEELGTGGEER